jgi:hypothetical protein
MLRVGSMARNSGAVVEGRYTVQRKPHTPFVPYLSHWTGPNRLCILLRTATCNNTEYTTLCYWQQRDISRYPVADMTRRVITDTVLFPLSVNERSVDSFSYVYVHKKLKSRLYHVLRTIFNTGYCVYSGLLKILKIHVSGNMHLAYFTALKHIQMLSEYPLIENTRTRGNIPSAVSMAIARIRKELRSESRPGHPLIF